jgi:hypothetical protein
MRGVEVSRPITFKLKNEALGVEFGTITFNGKFVFALDKNITPQQWRQVGFIPIEDDKTQVESDDLFYYLNSRLPMGLRKESPQSKLNYIKESGLRVASDSFALTEA